MLDILQSLAKTQKSIDFRLRRDDDGFERVVYAEVVIPEYLNTWGDYHTERSVREMAYAYMIKGFAIDVEHDQKDITGQAYVVESFVAREEDPDFIPGSWVIGVYVPDDDLWEKILSKEINGFSYEALLSVIHAEIEVETEIMYFGVTEPDPEDGHVHEFFVIVGADDKILSGGTAKVKKHSHPITRHTFTGKGGGHIHVFNYVKRIGEQ